MMKILKEPSVWVSIPKALSKTFRTNRNNGKHRWMYGLETLRRNEKRKNWGSRNPRLPKMTSRPHLIANGDIYSSVK